MAVVSISRIQIRRGKKQDLPQLASGEFGWAIDTQELYIGNGAVSEGAPYIGNTKLLGQHDDFFSLIDNYIYQKPLTYIQTGHSINFPVERTLQSRLDDRVSIKSFGAQGAGIDESDEIQRALVQLYLNQITKGSPQSRVKLHFEPGTYYLSKTIFIPPYTTIQGSGINKTIFISDTTDPSFVTIDERVNTDTFELLSTPSTLTQPRYIEMKDCSIETLQNNIALDLNYCNYSIFENIKISGQWDFNNQVDNIPAIRLSNFSTSVSSSYNKFNNIQISKYHTGIYSDYDIIDNTFDNCIFDTLDTAIVLGQNTILNSTGMLYGPTKNTIKNCIFDRIKNQAITIHTGKYNSSIENKFYNVGNEGGNSSNITTSIIKFNDYTNNSINDWFSRTNDLSNNAQYSLNVPYIPEVDSNTFTKLNQTYILQLPQLNQLVKLIKLPANTSRGYVIEYLYKSSVITGVRSGQLTLVSNPTTNTWSLCDDYEYTGNQSDAENLQISLEHYDENSDTIIDTLAIMMLNYTHNDIAEFHYTVKQKS